MLRALLLVLTAQAPPADRDWQLEWVRSWLSAPQELGGSATPPAGATELLPGTAPYAEVVSLVNRPCGLSGGPAPEVPEGHLWQVDLDGDGTPERLFSGGCSPEPFTVALKRGPAGWARWYSAEGLLLATRRLDGRVAFASARTGYGVARERVLSLALVEPDGKLVQRAHFSAVGEEAVQLEATLPGPCTLKANTALRHEPRVRDAPEESGMGFDYPGNLLQTLARGSRGLSLGRAKGFRLCAFAAPRPVEDASDTVKAMRRPALLTLQPEPADWLVGWVRESALERRAR